MPLNWKRILLLIGFFAAVIIFGWLLYALFLKPTVPEVPGPNANINVGPGGLPEAGVNVNIPTNGNVNGALPGGTNVNIGPPPSISPTTGAISETATGGLTETKVLTSNPAFQPTLAADGNNAIYYDKTTGLFYKITPDGKATPLTDQVFYDVENITWSPNKEKAVLEYPDGANIVYDFATNQQITLPNHWKDFSFSPNNDQLVLKSMGTDAENRWLAVAKADGSEAEKIELLGDKDATVYSDWSPSGQIIAIYREDKDFDRQNLYFVGLNDENLKTTVTEGRGFVGQWSTAGDRLLYSVYSSTSEYKPTLWIVEAQGDNIGQNRVGLKLETWADKCTFADNDTVYCAVPQNLTTGAGIFRSDLDTAPCDIYKIDLATGFKSKIAVPNGNHNIEKILVTDDGSYLYFNSKTDGKLYDIRLK
ncbi:MAG: hypothetical protein WC675_05710 [Patescibacteria group bacterium]|jgi:hypothetical protein